MNIIQKIAEEIVPLSRKQNVVLFTIIACIFQFAFFFAPALADEAVQQAQAQGNTADTIISNDSVAKDAVMDAEAAKLSASSSPAVVIPTISTSTSATTTHALATTTPAKVDKVVRESTHTITAYNSEVGQTDDSPCTTANGFNVCKHGVEDTIAANFLPMGTKVKIPELFGERIFIVRDRMNAKHPNRVDVWMKQRSTAIKFGVKVAKIQVIK